MMCLKIWFLADRIYGPAGGTEKQLLLLVTELQRLGHEVRLFVLRHTPYTRAAHDFPCTVDSLGVNSVLSWRTLEKMWNFQRLLDYERPHIVHTFFNDSAIVGPLFCRRKQTAVVTSRRDMGFWYNRRTLALLKMANKRASLVVCNAKAVAAQVRRFEKLPESRLLVIYNGVAHPAVTHPARSEQKSTEGYAARLAENGLRICLLANIRRIKRIEDFIEAAARIGMSTPKCEYLVIGCPQEADYLSELQVLARRLNVGGRLQFRGAVADSFGVLRHCDIGVLTSTSEGLSNSILEYMSAGLPVVCSDAGGNPELVTCGRNGLTYETGNVAQLAACLERLIRHPEQRSAMSAASLLEADRYSVKMMTEAHVKAYTKLINAA